MMMMMKMICFIPGQYAKSDVSECYIKETTF